MLNQEKKKKPLTAKTWVSCNSQAWTIFHPRLSLLPLFLSLASSQSSVPPPGWGSTLSLTDERPLPPHTSTPPPDLFYLIRPPTRGQIRASLADLNTTTKHRPRSQTDCWTWLVSHTPSAYLCLWPKPAPSLPFNHSVVPGGKNITALFSAIREIASALGVSTVRNSDLWLSRKAPVRSEDAFNCPIASFICSWYDAWICLRWFHLPHTTFSLSTWTKEASLNGKANSFKVSQTLYTCDVSFNRPVLSARWAGFESTTAGGCGLSFHHSEYKDFYYSV